MRASVIGVVVCLGGCATPPQFDLSISTDRPTFDGRTERAIIKVAAFDENGGPGTGVVEVTVGVGTLVEGSSVALVSGQGSVTYRCPPSEDPACAGAVRIGASWRGVSRTTTIRVTPNDPLAKPRWSVVPTLKPVSLLAAALAPDGTVWAVGEKGLVLPFRRGAWGTPIETFVESTLRAVIVNADGSLEICGDQGVVLSGMPDRLNRLSHSSTADFTAIARSKDGTLVVTTTAGEAGLYSGTDFVFSSLSGSKLNGLAATPSGTLVAIGNTTLHEFDGAQWKSLTPPVIADWRHIRVDDAGWWILGRRVALTQEPLLVQGPGPDWRSTTLPPGDVQAMAWGVGSADRYIVTDRSVYWKQENTGWVDLETPSGGKAIVVLGGTEVLVVGPPGISLLRVQ
jgi:hypothetical protein